MIRPKEWNYFFSRPAIGENNFCLWTEPDKKMRELAAVVPPKKNFKEQWAYDKELYKKRNEVERFFRRLKRFRRIFTRYDKLDILFAMIIDSLVWTRPNKLFTFPPDNLSISLAKLYNEETMPDELRHAHKSNDYAVALAYGFENILEDEAAIVAQLMKLYRRLTNSWACDRLTALTKGNNCEMKGSQFQHRYHRTKDPAQNG